MTAGSTAPKISARSGRRNSRQITVIAVESTVTVKRTWRAEGQNVNRMVDLTEVENIMKALDNGWVITFPQG